MYMGVIAACAVAFSVQGLPSMVAVPICILSAALAGAAYGFIPGFLKAKLDVSELLSTVMLNYAAAQFYKFCIRLPLRDPNDATGTPMSARLPDNNPYQVLPRNIFAQRYCSGSYSGGCHLHTSVQNNMGLQDACCRSVKDGCKIWRNKCSVVSDYCHVYLWRLCRYGRLR